MMFVSVVMISSISFLRQKSILALILQRSGLKLKRKEVWLRDNEPDYYKECRLEDRDIFEQWIEKGYV